MELAMHATKPLQFSLFGVSSSSGANRYAVALGLGDENKKLTLVTLTGKNTNTNSNNNSDSGGNINVYNGRGSRISNLRSHGNVFAITIVNDIHASNNGWWCIRNRQNIVT